MEKVLPVHCKACGAQWTVPMHLPMALSRFIKALRGFAAAGCPQCGAFGEDVLLGPVAEVTSDDR